MRPDKDKKQTKKSSSSSQRIDADAMDLFPLPTFRRFQTPNMQDQWLTISGFDHDWLYNTRCHTFFKALEMSDFIAQKSSNQRKHFQLGLIRENLHITFRLSSNFFLSFGRRSRVEIALQKKRIVSYFLILVQKMKKTVRARRCVTLCR